MGLRNKILITIIGPLAVLLLVFTVLDLRGSRVEAVDAAGAVLEDQVRVAAIQLDGLLLRMSQIAETSAIAIRDQDEWPDPDLRDLGARLVESDADIFGLAVGWRVEDDSYLLIHRSGDEVTFLDGAEVSADGHLPLFDRLRETRTSFWAAPHEAEALAGFDAAAHLVPIESEGELLGGVAIILDPESFRKLADRIGLGDSRWLIMADDGTVVASSEATAQRLAGVDSVRGRNLFALLDEGGVSAAELQSLRTNLRDKDVFVQIPDEDAVGEAPRVAAIARLNTTPWFLVTGEPIETIIGPVYESVFERTVLDVLLVVTAVVIVQIGAWFTVVRPLRRVVSVVDRAAHGKALLRADLPGQDEIAVLGRTIDEALPRLAELAVTRAAMANARAIQESLVPATPCHGRGVTIAGRVEPCDETGGDYFGHTAFEDGRTVFTLGDATGHGLPAALLVATARAYVRSAVRHADSMADAITEANTRLVEDSPAGLFMVLVHACYDGNSGDLELVSAGQPAWVFRRGEEGFQTIDASGIPLGIAPTTYESRRLGGLASGDTVLLASDGAWEVRNERGDMLGMEAMLAEARRLSGLEPMQQVEGLFRFVHDFAGDRPLDDDCTIVIARIEDR